LDIIGLCIFLTKRSYRPSRRYRERTSMRRWPKSEFIRIRGIKVTGRKMEVRWRIVSGHKQRSEIVGGPQRKI